MSINRENFSDIFTDLCRTKFQARVVCRAAGDTIWIYLPYTPGRSGFSATKADGSILRLEYKVASINPYKTIDPAELKFVVQKVLAEIRSVMLQTVNPYKFFVLVVTDIQSPLNLYDQWHIVYLDDLKRHGVCADFSGEGYNRLVWHQEKVAIVEDKDGNKVSKSYLDIKGEHVDYHDITLKEFVEKQINWRIYKRFTIDYNKIPFDLTAQEKQDEVIHIIKTVFWAYNFKEFESVYIKNMSLLEEQRSPDYYSREDLQKYKTYGIIRKPSF